MSTLLWNAARRVRPRVGWPQAILALGVAICPAIAATDSKLTLPAGLFFWAGVIGLWLGLRAGRPAADHRPFDPSTLRLRSGEPALRAGSV